MHPVEKKSVLIVTSTFPRWKGDTDPAFVYDLAATLAKQGSSVTVIAPHAAGASRQEQLDDITVIRYRYFIPAWQTLCYQGGIPANLRQNPLNYLLIPFFALAMLFCYLRVVRQQQFDVVNAHWLLPQGLICAVGNLLLGKQRLPLVCTSHGSDVNALNDVISTRLKAWTLSQCRRLIVVSKSLRDKINTIERCGDKIVVCSMGIDMATMFIRQTGVVREPERLIYVGRLIDGKGVDCLLQAMRRVYRERQGAKLVIIGDGPAMNDLKQQAEQLQLEQAVVFTGAMRRNRLPEQYSLASIFILPSRQEEGFGLVTIEAMACECAVICTNHPSARELVSHEANGLLCPVDDAETMASCIIRLLDDAALRQRLATKAREDVVARFDWQQVLPVYIDAMFSD